MAPINELASGVVNFDDLQKRSWHQYGVGNNSLMPKLESFFVENNMELKRIRVRSWDVDKDGMR